VVSTPIVNTLVDAYAYLRFLKIRPWYDWDEFNARIARNERKRREWNSLYRVSCLTTFGPADLAITRLHAVMSIFLLRRQKNTKLDGEPIIKLPPKEIKLVKLEFSKEERDIYDMVEARNQAIFNRYLRAGTVLKYVTFLTVPLNMLIRGCRNYHHVLVLLLRLRQICSHPSLVAEDADAYAQPHEADEDFRIEFANELTRAARLVSEDFVAKMKARFYREALARIEAEKSVRYVDFSKIMNGVWMAYLIPSSQRMRLLKRKTALFVSMP
jgi:SNF2 family DNA or RNA helicase